MTLLITLLSFIFILGAAVVIHEFGHFAVGKLLGIRVETFSVGFGPRIFGRRYGTTDYRLSLIPLGGYVKFGGDESNAAIEGASEENIPERERFDLRPRWHKFLVIIAGPMMNILSALAVVAVSALMYGVPASPPPIVRNVVPNGAAAVAGLQRGDRFVEFNGKQNPTWERIRLDAGISPDQEIPVVVERDGQRVPLTFKPRLAEEQGQKIGELDFRFDFGSYPVIVNSVEDGMPAAEAGLKPGDHILAINGEQMFDDSQVSEYISDHKGEPLRLSVERGNQKLELNATTRPDASGRERLGFGPTMEIPLQSVGFGGALVYAVNRNLEIIRVTGSALGQVFSGQRSARDTFAGPIGIARATGDAVNRGGVGGGVTMFGFLSLNLGVVNLLPIPVLDGGAIAILFIEFLLGVVGLSLSMAVRERIQQVGFVLLLLLMGSVIVNDLVKEAVLLRGGNKEQPTVSAPK